MSIESAHKCLEDLKAGKVDFDVKQIANVSDHDAAMKHILALGYDFTPEEMLEATNASNFHGKKISMAGAEAVAGGKTVDWVAAGGAGASGAAAAGGAAAACA